MDRNGADTARYSHLDTFAMTGGALDVGFILLLGFSLGMRHATDADHVVAIAAIVSRERSVAGSALIGAAWGAGHTVTVMAVGSAIILFGFVIPPRLGLAMEFAVGVMLVVLGILTLAGVGRSDERAHARVTGGRELDVHDQCMRMATTFTGTGTVTAPARTGTQTRTRRWHGSTAVGSAGSRSMTGCDPSWSASYMVWQGLPLSP